MLKPSFKNGPKNWKVLEMNIPSDPVTEQAVVLACKLKSFDLIEVGQAHPPRCQADLRWHLTSYVQLFHGDP
jgi:hypothetical protein